MSVKEMALAIGATGELSQGDGLGVSVKVLDAKSAYGTIRYLVTPLAGSGSTWVMSNRVKIGA